MTTTLKYVGKKTDLVGKTLWEILGNLKDFGIGRIILRNSMASRYKEPCYMRVLKVQAQPNEVPPKIKVFRPPNDLRDKDRARQVYVQCEYVFRGVKYVEPQWIESESCLPDYRLVPKHLEGNYTFSKTNVEVKNETILPRYTEFPPLLSYLLKKSGVKEPKMECVEKTDIKSLYRLAKEGEQPTRTYESGFGTPRNPDLYKTINHDI